MLKIYNSVGLILEHSFTWGEVVKKRLKYGQYRIQCQQEEQN